MYRIILLVICAALLTTACFRIERRAQITITPGQLPEQLQGARWPQTPVHYCVVRSDLGYVSFEEFAAIAADAFSRWGIETVDDGECGQSQTAGNGINEVGWGYPPEGPNAVYEAGQTEVQYQRSPADDTARIVEADIDIDPEPQNGLRNADCLRTVLMHEAGHFFGVPHLSSPAIMAPVSTSCDQELTDADRAALDELYGAD